MAYSSFSLFVRRFTSTPTPSSLLRPLLRPPSPLFFSSSSSFSTSSSSKLSIVNPATEEVVASLSQDNQSSIEEKISRAVKAQKSWKNVPLERKIEIISKANASIVARHQELAQTLTLEMGKPITQALNEVKALKNRLDFFLNNVKEVLTDQVPVSNAKLEEKITADPLGVVANVSAWNYPYFVSTNVLIPGLLTGNAVAFKPSEYATLSGQHLVKILIESGIPEDVLPIIIGRGDVGATLVSNPKISGVFFTGSVPTGEKISKLVAGRNIKLQLELGGKDPTYVCEDVDIERAADSLADGAFYNTGQSCCSVERIYVNSKIYDEFVKHFVKVVKSFKIGDPRDNSTYIGAVTRPQHLPFLESQVKDAVSKGAKLLVGGKPTKVNGKGSFFEPTVLIDVNHQMSVMKDESFGPIIGIAPVHDDESAIALMNDSEFGLTSGVYTKNRERAVNIMKRLESGTVYWNCCDRVSPNLPWSGVKNSGVGLTMSKEGIKIFTRPKAWHLSSP